ncbi:MAG: DNA repair helicase XPB [Spirochaetia bacterium]
MRYFMVDSALIMQSDSSILLDTHSPNFEEVRAVLLPFAELIKSPEHFHVYRITALSIWNAAACGITLDSICKNLKTYSRYPIAESIFKQIHQHYTRYGMLILEEITLDDQVHLLLRANAQDLLLKEVISNAKIKKNLIPYTQGFLVPWQYRGTLKQELINMGWPVEDRVPLVSGEPLAINVEDSWSLRAYQISAMKAFLGNEGAGTGFGIIVLPCGSGKTLVAIGLMAQLKTETLILTANTASSRQWKDEIMKRTCIKEEDIGEYSSASKQIRPITIATYQILVWRANREEEFHHFDLFRQRAWGFVIYDEAHLLPAPVFRVTAELQSVRRLGLTATLVREDGAEKDIFSLIGPKRFDVPWLELEKQGFIAQAYCFEIHIELSPEDDLSYVTAPKSYKNRIAATNKRKIPVAEKIIKKYPDEPTLIIGQYIDQLTEFSKFFNAPIITGKTPNGERDRLYSAFRDGHIRLLIVSKVANFSIDLPDASIAIQISGSFGSRQEEAQRLGRILRPKDRPSYFYSLVSLMTVEEEFANNRHKFLAEQGYSYEILNEGEFL